MADRVCVVIGDLSVDFLSTVDEVDAAPRLADGRDVNVDSGSQLRIGGTAWLFSEALMDKSDTRPLILSTVGEDLAGEFIRSHVASVGLASEGIEVPTGFATSTCSMTYFADKQRLMLYPSSAPKGSSTEHVNQFLTVAQQRSPTCTWLSGHTVNKSSAEWRKLLRLVCDSMRDAGSRVVVDLVPHRFREAVGELDLVDGLLGVVDGVVGELPTLLELVDLPAGHARGVEGQMKQLAELTSRRYRLGVVQGRFDQGSYGQAVALDGDLISWQREPLAGRSLRGLGDQLSVDALIVAQFL
ncbi:carbohydrate kinase family protein [Amycolatopsis panacis]|uniref:Carbohydrate kinase family protein n=1 Tax=Amycolatopsis panacis TaxID=2340917 RepID=A0A419HXG7_9PSEU|nr:carbohydrate kinase family protein [Amycolatopsis panacis]RJQ81684.1 carbohydrate kinase family protein [Amycolatopsis panacis]